MVMTLYDLFNDDTAPRFSKTSCALVRGVFQGRGNQGYPPVPGSEDMFNLFKANIGHLLLVINFADVLLGFRNRLFDIHGDVLLPMAT